MKKIIYHIIKRGSILHLYQQLASDVQVGSICIIIANLQPKIDPDRSCNKSPISCSVGMSAISF